MAIKVKLRQKPISNNRQSLYLDFYPAIDVIGKGKKSRREFLGLYIMDRPKTPLEKADNKRTLLLAEQIRQKRNNELNKPEVYTAFELEQLKIKQKGELSFLKYYITQMDKRKGANYQSWEASFYYLETFSNGSLKFADLNEKFCDGYKAYLLTAKSKKRSTTISQNTAYSYFNKFKATLKQAYRDSLLNFDLNSKIRSIKQGETNRVFLSLEEVNLLAKAECPNPILKRASLFSILTGLRFSDIEKLKWSEVNYVESQGYFLRFKQQKTGSNEYSPISEQAYSFLGERGDSNDRVFKELKYSAHQNSLLLKWAINAGIQKHLTFHSFRHTYATLQLNNGTDLYTVSKMLGHKDIKTTQIYAKIIDQTKRDTTHRISLDLE